jgi:23S rRNA pseudouridine1911/1915/1917 synthase
MDQKPSQQPGRGVSLEIISTGLRAVVPQALAVLADEAEWVDASDEPESAAEVRSFTVGLAEHGVRIDKVLSGWCAGFSRSYFQDLLDAGGVQLNRMRVHKAAAKVKVGDVVEVELRPTAQAQAFAPEAMPLAVVHEDEHMMVIDKPAGLVVHPAAGHWQGTLLNGLLAYHAAAQRLPRAGIVHRLDKDTSGLMLVAKTQPAFDGLVALIAQRQVHRVYLALAQGAWRQPNEVWVDRPMGRDPKNRLRMAVLPEGASGSKAAQTGVRVLHTVPGYTLVACKLHTGRTHQIRVHMASLGHPLVGDVLYGGKAAWGMTRQALHAHRLALRHPVTGQVLRVQAPVPHDLQQALDSAGLHYNPDQLWQADLG